MLILARDADWHRVGAVSSAARQPGASSSQACSVLSASVNESAYGTATPAVAWLALEQAGPWGRDAVLDSHLRPDLGRSLAESVGAANGRFALIRRPGPHADDHQGHLRRVLVAHCRPGAEWLVAAEVTDPQELLAVDFSALGEGDLAGVLASLPGSGREERAQLLVCTNGRRDVCCAVRGRPVAEGAAAANPGQVWETAHTGGHRFAPTAVLLPSGLTLGRLTASQASDALVAAQAGKFPLGLTGPRHDRGRCALSPPAQVAESAVRHRVAEAAVNALRVAPAPSAPSARPAGAANWEVDHVDGRRWEVSVLPSTTGVARPVSCGRPAERQHRYDVAITSVDVRREPHRASPRRPPR